MEKILYLSLLTCSVFSMQLVAIKERVKRVHEKLIRHHLLLAPATFAGLEACFAPHIELTAQAASLAGGILGAVITGPV